MDEFTVSGVNEGASIPSPHTPADIVREIRTLLPVPATTP